MKFFLKVTLAALVLCTSAQAATYHVSKSGSNTNKGTADAPFLTISKAAYLAIAGDSIVIHEGVYRENVSPKNSGLAKYKMINYLAAEGEEVVISGAEQVKNWTKTKDGIWTAKVDNAIFGDYNPFDIKVFGDWLIRGGNCNLGEVYINGKALRQNPKLDSLKITQYTWLSEVKDSHTVIYANFANLNPNKDMTEINVRETCFFPKKTGVNYIKVKGIHITKAAPQWAPPTAEQIGAIGPNWSKGWVIEDCEVSYSKCVGISLGKESASGQNRESIQQGKGWTKQGFSYEIEAIIKAEQLGWSKEMIGSHTINNNYIHDCGQAGIVGHMGCAFSTISNNLIKDINQETDMWGHEIAGIKLHAAIDAIIENNVIINSYRGLWLDWQAQGTHVIGNVMSDNKSEDLFTEVSHGPTLIYNNVLLSNVGYVIDAQGIAFFNNFVRGILRVRNSPERYTPYHIDHSTKIKGYFNSCGGDIRIYNNIFMPWPNGTPAMATAAYNKYPANFDNFKRQKSAKEILETQFPAFISNNVYIGSHSRPRQGEKNKLILEAKEKQATLVCKDGKYYLDIDLSIEELKKAKTLAINTPMLGSTYASEYYFENPDGTCFVLDKDLFGDARAEKPIAGPFEKAINDRAVWGE